MSLPKLLSLPLKIFQKDVISFLVIRRHDLGSQEEAIRYIAVKPYASIVTLRQKIWHLLDLPDYCEEIIVLKLNEVTEVPLTELRKGNQPNCPFILEVWLPDSDRRRSMDSTTTINKMLTMGRNEEKPLPLQSQTESDLYEKTDAFNSLKVGKNESATTMTTDTMAFSKLPVNHKFWNLTSVECGKIPLYSRISNTTIFAKQKKSKDNLTTVLLKIQSDLAHLSVKLSNLENKIPV